MELENALHDEQQKPQSFEQKDPVNKDKAEYLKILKESLKKAVFYIFVFSALINLLTLALPLYSLQVFDRVLSSGSIPTLTSLTVIAIFLLSMFSIFNSVREYILIKISSWLDNKLNEKTFKLSVNHSSLSGQRMNSQFVMEANTVKAFVTSPQIFALFDLPWSLVFIFVIYLISPEISLLVVIGAVILFGLTYYKDFKIKPQIKETNDISGRNMKRGDEFIRHSEVVEAMGMFGNIFTSWKNENSLVKERTARTSFLSSRLSSISKMLRMILQIAIIGLGTYLALNKMMTSGGIIACSILAGKALGPCDAIMALWSSLGNFKDSYNKLNIFLNSSIERPVATNLGKPGGDISTEKVVFFKPGTMNPIIKGLDIKIESGDIIGVIGPSGSGKSTMIKLLAGIYKPSMGIVRVDGGDVFFRNREDIGRYIGYLPQSIDLLRGTIKENISRFDPDAKDDDVVIAAKKTGVHELILGLPEGYNTIIGEGNVELSGGQKQRVGLARAFYGDPSMIFLDEPNANLDEVGEAMLIRSILIAKQEGRTIMMISHKPSIVNVVSKIIVIKDGQLLDFGTREEIMNKYTRAGTKPSGMAKPSGQAEPASEIKEIIEDIKFKKTDD